MEHLFFLPRISKQEEHGNLIEWRKGKGDFITAKASSVPEAPASGILKQILIPSGEWLEVTNPVGIITIKK